MRYTILCLSVFIALYFQSYLVLIGLSLIGSALMVMQYLKFTEFIQKMETEELWYQMINNKLHEKID